MQLEKQFKIEKIMSKTRPDLGSGYIEENGSEMSRLVATDGHKLACVPFIADDIDRGNPAGLRIPIDAIKAMRKNGGYGVAEKEKLSVNGVRYPMASEAETTFPDYKQVIPDPEKCDHHTVTLNPKFLLDLADAIGGRRGVTLHLPENPLEPIRITTSDEPGALGVLMPMRNSK